MKIIAIEPITQLEKKELEKLEEDEKHRTLLDEEKNRKLFLGMKQFWNCEC